MSGWKLHFTHKTRGSEVENDFPGVYASEKEAIKQMTQYAEMKLKEFNQIKKKPKIQYEKYQKWVFVFTVEERMFISTRRHISMDIIN